ncbi:hypothetical protein [Paraburkholderia sp. DHOC27]|uniref:hypothetical protein n=1 Tax=Paraburkholderia sp. DHOC27 TaxID=2303330 RepID=UPI0011C160C4|nr:hypothetical protein [Paraburkholderia sp. DHOC27]
MTFSAVAMAGALSGCVQFTPVKDIAKDKPGYLAANFTIESLPSSVREKLPPEGSHPLPFKVLSISGSVSGHIGANNTSSNFTTTFVNTKDTGLVQQLHEVSSNGIPSAATFSLSYLNLYSLKQETTSYFTPIAPQPNIAHDIDQNPFNIVKPEENSTFSTTVSLGYPAQLVNFRVIVATCHTGRYYSASRVNAGLSGNAIDLDCEETKDGILQDTTRRTYLSEYGIYVVRSVATAAAKLEWQYIQFDKDGQRTEKSSGAPAVDKPA